MKFTNICSSRETFITDWPHWAVCEFFVFPQELPNMEFPLQHLMVAFVLLIVMFALEDCVCR